MKNIFLKGCFALLLLFLCSTSSFSLEVETHKALNEYISTKTVTPNGFSLGTYLKDQSKLLPGGIEEKFNSLEAWKWLRDGGEYEDIPVFYLRYLRSLNHFHNPITEEGFKGNCGGISLCVSSTVWALMPLGTQSSITGNYSWNDVRDYYYKALTSSEKTLRDTNFAQTFRGLGQLMHLIQDASVPAHTRNDAHLFGYHYEKWVKNNPGALTTAASSPHFFSGTINNITSLIDTDQYNGTNPSSSNTIGLSEYTQANFFSEDTINNSSFPNPKISDTTTTIVERNFTNTFWNTTYPRQYYLKNCCGETNNNQGYLLSTVDFLHDYRVAQRVNLTQPDIPILDDNVYSDYASLLLPRAVGYSASLINYFFRGQINMEKDPNNSSQYIIKNESDEYMSGTFALYYDDATDNRRYLTSWNKYINPKSISDSVTFTKPTDAKEKGKYILVFQGTLGSETGAVVGRIVEFKGGIGRVVGVSGNSITVYMEDGGTITGSLPPLPASITRSRAISVRFDKNDWNIFVVLTIYCDDPGCRNGYYAFHKYSINPDKTLNYHGVVLTKEVFPSVELSNNLIESEQPESGYYAEIFALTTKVSYFICVDFFLKGGYIKPFGVINEIDYSFEIAYQSELTSSGSWERYRVYATSRSDKRTAKIYYGGVIEEMTLKECTNGSGISNAGYPCIDYNKMVVYPYSDTSATAFVPGYVYPLGIFSETDYASIRYYDRYEVRRKESWTPYLYSGVTLPWGDVDYLITTLPITSPLQLPSNSYIRTTLREENKYSFFQRMYGSGGCGSSLAQKIVNCPGVLSAGPWDPYDPHPTIEDAVSYHILDVGTWWDANKSYSSETGAMNCQNVLILNSISDEGYYLAWKAGSFVKFKNCSDWKLLEGGGSGNIFDVSVTD
jgi:hypothetical protein